MRNARLILDLHHELERRQVPLLVANLPGASFDGATGRYLFSQLCSAAQLQRDLDSERMTGIQRRLVEDGRHRVEKRGRDERRGRHKPILSEAEFARTVAAIASRRRVGQKPRPFRHYVLRGLVHCPCGTRMRGEAHLQRGTERRYYRCPTLGCRARRCPADDAEAAVLGAIAGAVLPDAAINAARTELRHRLQTPDLARVGRQRARLLTRLEQLKKQHSWGDLGDAEYQRERDALRAALGELPDGDRITAFDAYRARIVTLPEAIAAASPARREELCQIVVERVIVRDRQVEAIEWTPPARPFFGKRQRECPQGASGTRPLSDEDPDEDPLAWYVA